METRLPFWSYHFLFGKTIADSNPYLADAWVSVPLWEKDKKIAEDCRNRPGTGKKLSAFMLAFRPQNRKQAAYFMHAVKAGELLLLKKTEALSDAASAPLMPTKKAGEESGARFYDPSPEWKSALSALREAVIAFNHETNGINKSKASEKITAALLNWQEINLREDLTWNGFYRDSIAYLLRLVEDEKKQLDRRNAEENPFGINPFTTEELSPERGNALVGRDEQLRAFERFITSGASLPFVVLRGQRRTGKSSLSLFLPTRLGAGFKVIQAKAEGAGGLHNVLKKIAREAGLKLPEAGDFSAFWAALKTALREKARNDGRRFVIIIDEYEYINRDETREEENRERLFAFADWLGDLRTFLSEQKEVVLMLVGMAFLDDLLFPPLIREKYGYASWASLFVRAEYLTVGYLSKEASDKVMRQAEKLEFTPAALQMLCDYTQGHPKFLQIAGDKLFQSATEKRKAEIGIEEMQEVLQKHVRAESEQAFTEFYYAFCGAKADEYLSNPQSPYLQILANVLRDHSLISVETFAETSPERKHAYHRLLRYDFLIKDEAGGILRFCAPAFEDWLRTFKK
jgi:hypothetical protein